MLEFLPTRIKTAVSHVNVRQLYELRLRVGLPATANYGGKYLYLCEFGVSDQAKNALVVSSEEVEDTVYLAGKCSVYSVEEQIRRGFLTAENGERIGLAGEYVMEGGKVVAMRNFTSLCIRIPHEIDDCGAEIFEKCFTHGLCNLLILSPPGIGKTTILRDLSRKISETTKKNVLICDERGEISALGVGESCDVVKFGNKNTAFEAAIRAMRPDLLICDELTSPDYSAVKRMVEGGVYVVASAHFASVQNVPNALLEIFDCYAQLSKDEIGRLDGTFSREEVCALGRKDGQKC